MLNSEGKFHTSRGDLLLFLSYAQTQKNKRMSEKFVCWYNKRCKKNNYKPGKWSSLILPLSLVFLYWYDFILHKEYCSWLFCHTHGWEMIKIINKISDPNLTLPMLRLISSKAQKCKRFWKRSKPCWYSLDSSRWALSDEYPFARGWIIFQVFCIISNWQN